MAIPSGNHHARQHNPLFMGNHMFNTLSGVHDAEQLKAKITAVGLKVTHLQLAARVGHVWRALRPRRVNVVHVEPL